MKFVFKAKTREGEVKNGDIEAVSREAALQALEKNNLFPIFVTESNKDQSPLKMFLKYYDRVTPKEMVVFFRQLAILIDARVPVTVSLNAINSQTTNRYFQRIIKEMISDIEDGMPLSSSLEKHSDVFSHLSVSIIRAGETSGNLQKSILYVADNIEKNYQLTARVRSALIYPAVVIVVFFIIGFIVITFILPKLTQAIKDMAAEVPWYTKLVMDTGDFMQKYWWAVAIAIIGAVLGLIYYIKTDNGKREFDQIKIRFPIIGIIFKYVYLTRFAENLSVLLNGGIPILQALKEVSNVVGNSEYEALFLKTAEEVKVGGTMSSVLSRSDLIPPMMSQMIKVGEESGQISSTLDHVARFYSSETEIMTKNLSTLIEPILMIFIGIGVGFMAFSILMPIYNIASQIK
ncbi:MAG: type II secretion system F family protein [Candidatus Moranbacteria bacterium]|nr:type II secretion system F family protein [Candidatus Moranbacteria bacterium]